MIHTIKVIFIVSLLSNLRLWDFYEIAYMKPNLNHC